MDGTAGAVLDASAVRLSVGSALAEGAVINVVNYAEVLSRLSDRGDEPATAHQRFEQQGLIGGLLEVIPLLGEDAVTIARLRPVTRAQGLSLGDRACLATALRLERTVLTADRGWATIDVGGPVHLIRPWPIQILPTYEHRESRRHQVASHAIKCMIHDQDN